MYRRLICEQPNGKTILKILSISEIHSPNLMNNDVKTASIPHLNSKSSGFFSKICVSGISISFKQNLTRSNSINGIQKQMIHLEFSRNLNSKPNTKCRFLNQFSMFDCAFDSITVCASFLQEQMESTQITTDYGDYRIVCV